MGGGRYTRLIIRTNVERTQRPSGIDWTTVLPVTRATAAAALVTASAVEPATTRARTARHRLQCCLIVSVVCDINLRRRPPPATSATRDSASTKDRLRQRYTRNQPTRTTRRRTLDLQQTAEVNILPTTGYRKYL